ncbi:SusD/RagB family nutrient-binding outer membrane lipoprotein [Daejeonella lutea]|uniref:Starch-binding associating with outer membrane n=1 Tax=Daejeonella lutea TaxID=572036 RepID=A0A1T5AWC6_9SPHI|nr:SusD/RagB family nutrient-binding outer membrane lipoprotein [Daejeonella lutea]SKB39070.1 Starch-binding associating with outer membrane [Daejeonella lutea]
MQKIYKYTFILATAAALVFQSCGKEYFDELSANPNQVNVPTLPALLATATSKAGLRTYDAGSVINPYVQYTANPTAGAASDIYETIDFTGTWDGMYFAMADINEMKKLAMAQGSSEYLGVANLLIAYHLIIVNNFWGAAPFSEAFNPSNFTPKYDTDQEIYATTVKLVDDAITELTKTTATVKLAAGSDLIHQGDRAKWLKTAYAIKARLLIKTSKTPTFNAAAVLTALGNSYTSNADDAGMATFQTRNNWATVSRNNASLTLGGWLSEQFIDHLNGTTYGLFDPRLPKITEATTVPNNATYPKWIGTVNGAGNRNNPPHNNTVKDENYISFLSPWTNDTAPILLVTYAELKFIEAEAAFATDKPRAYAAYLAGIRANMDKLQVATADRDAYVADPRVSVGATNLTLALIFKEKYVATYLNPEAWNDARRHNYGYKDFGMPLNAVLPTFIRRLDYPIGERSKNGTQVPAATVRTTRLWWDL